MKKAGEFLISYGPLILTGTQALPDIKRMLSAAREMIFNESSNIIEQKSLLGDFKNCYDEGLRRLQAGEYLLGMKYFSLALDNYLKGLRLANQEWNKGNRITIDTIYFSIAKLFEIFHMPDDVIRRTTYILDDSPSDGAALFLRAKAYLLMNNIKKAAVDLERMEKYFDDNILLVKGCYGDFIGHNSDALIRKVDNHVKKSESVDPALLMMQGWAYFSQGLFTKAIESLARAMIFVEKEHELNADNARLELILLQNLSSIIIVYALMLSDPDPLLQQRCQQCLDSVSELMKLYQEHSKESVPKHSLTYINPKLQQFRCFASVCLFVWPVFRNVNFKATKK